MPPHALQFCAGIFRRLVAKSEVIWATSSVLGSRYHKSSTWIGLLTSELIGS